jgi:uncharacterized protein
MRVWLKSVCVILTLSVLCTSAWAVDAALATLPFTKKMQLAKAGDPDAKMAVAEAYETGTDAKLDPAKAAKWYREAALTGNVEAQFRLFKLVRKGAPGLNADPTTALKLLQTAAKLGHPGAQNQLGLMLQNGDGIAKDEKAAVDWYKKASDQKFASAQTNLGVLYLKGIGIDRNLLEAFKLFVLAAAQEDGWAMNNLGGMYEMGWGTTKDMTKAKELYEKASAKGIAMATQNLARLTIPAGATATIPAGASAAIPAKP